MWIIYAFLAALFAGLTSILAKIGITNTDSHVATALRTVVILIFAWIMVFVVGSIDTLSSISTKSLLFLVLSGLTTGGSWICYFRALQLGDVNKVIPIDKSSTILTMLLAVIVLHEPISALKIVCMILIAIGTYMMIAKQSIKQSVIIDESKLNAGKSGSTLLQSWKQAFQGNTAWLIYAVFSAIFASMTAILGKIGVQNVESNLATAIRTIVVLVMAWLIVFGLRKQSALKYIEKKSWWFIGLSGLATGLSWLFYYRALQEGLASIVVPIDKLSIVVSIAFGYFVLKEKLNRKSFTGLVLIVAGTLLLLV